jgi:hypothetical protein
MRGGVSLSLSEDMDQFLAFQAKRLKRSKSSIAEELLNNGMEPFFSKWGGAPSSPKRKKRAAPAEPPPINSDIVRINSGTPVDHARFFQPDP